MEIMFKNKSKRNNFQVILIKWYVTITTNGKNLRVSGKKNRYRIF